MSAGICRWLILLISLSAWITVTNSKEMRVVCYYTNWSVYRPGTAKFSPQNINPYLCTHLIYAFGGFTKENTLKPFDKYQDIEKGGYAKFTGLKTYNKNLKTMLAIGGWNEGSSRFSPMVANPERRKELVKNTVKFLRQNHFDGLDLDWEYPSFRDGGKPRDRDNYAHLVKELREEFERESEKTGRPRLLLTMAVPAGIEYINKGYDVPKLTKYLDWMNILSYDYHSAFEPAVNHHAPLYSLEEESEYNYDTELNIDYTIKHYIKQGADPTKLVMGIPTYGRSYTLFNPDANEIGAPADGPGEMGEATRENGYLAYYEICDYVKSQDWEVVQPNEKAMGPYAYKDNQWVGYDDEKIVRKKAEYVAEHNLGGIMFWAIDNDDFRGSCHGRPYPLIEAAKEALLEAYGITDENLISPPSKPVKPKTRTRSRTSPKTEEKKESEDIPRTSTNSRRRNRVKSNFKAKEQSKPRRKETPRTTEGTSTYSSLKVVTPSYTTPAPPSTPDQGGAFKCEDEGFFPHPKDCKKYFWCLGGPGDTGIVAHQFTCPAGLYFNKAADSCDYTQNVLCNKKLSRATTTTEGTEIKTATTTTTTTPKPFNFFSTTRAPPKITAATSKTTFKFTTTEATIEDDYEDEDDYEEDDNVRKLDSEEDPRVIKELIDLIRKAGGIEELEKQLKVGTDNTKTDSTTQSALSKTLYERVLASRNSITSKKNTYTSINRNSRGPQNDGIIKNDKERPQYTSISRQRSSASGTTVDDDDKDDNLPEDDENKSLKSYKKSSEPNYVNIRRPKVTSTTEETLTESRLNRNKFLGEGDDEEDNANVYTSTQHSSPQYVNIRRQRPTTTTTESSTENYIQIRRGTTSQPESNNEELTSKYKVIRRGSTTQASIEEDAISKKTRGTISTTSPHGNDVTSKYTNIRRGSIPPTSTVSQTTRFKTATRGPTTEVVQETPDITTDVNQDEIATTDPILSSTPEIVIVNTGGNSLTSKLTSEESTTTTIKLSSNPDITTELITLTDSNTNTPERKTPQLLEPRPFSLNSRGTTPKAITESTTQPTKPIRSTVRPFRIGGRRKPTTTRAPSTTPSPTSRTTTSLPVASSRTTKFARRKYLPQTIKALESQVNSTKAPIADSRFRFVSRKPISRTTTIASTTTTAKPKRITNTDQTIESSNQESLEEGFEDDENDTTELGDIAVALHDIQQAPIPRKTTALTYSFSTTTQKLLPTVRATSPKTKIRYVPTTSSIFYTTTRPIVVRKKRPPQAFEKIKPSVYSETYIPIGDYDYYDDSNGSILGQIPEHSKVLLHSNGVIECLDQGNFPHPVSCKKFISCAKMENGKVLGWEYTCPKNLSFDPIGGICNWSAGLGCNEK